MHKLNNLIISSTCPSIAGNQKGGFAETRRRAVRLRPIVLLIALFFPDALFGILVFVKVNLAHVSSFPLATRKIPITGCHAVCARPPKEGQGLRNCTFLDPRKTESKKPLRLFRYISCSHHRVLDFSEKIKKIEKMKYVNTNINGTLNLN